MIERARLLPTEKIVPKTKVWEYLTRVLDIAETLKVRSAEIGGLLSIAMLAVANRLINWVARISKIFPPPRETEIRIKELLEKPPLEILPTS